MATRKSKRQPKRKSPYDRPLLNSSEPSTWNKKKLVQELKELGIDVPVDFEQPLLVKLYKSNVKSKQTEVVSDTPTIDDNIQDQTTPNNDISNKEPVQTTQMIANITAQGDQMNNICNAFVSMSQCFTGLQNTVTQLLKNQGDKSNEKNKEGFTLGSWYKGTAVTTPSCPSVLPENSPSETNRGVRSDSYSNVDIVSPSLQRQIIDGKDVNMAALLIPNYECPQSLTAKADTAENNAQGKPDIRLNRSLSISEFVHAFGKYKTVMCNAYPERRSELDAYEKDIINISNFYGSKFYDYHKMFSAKAATLLREQQVKVDWGKRDRDLFTLVAAGVQINVCKLCHMCDHTTEFCLLQLRGQSSFQSHSKYRNEERNDRYGRQKLYQDGKEICNNFNDRRGCTKRSCSFLHICNKCRLPGHSQIFCSKRPSTTTSSNQTVTAAADKELPKTRKT